jgi:predicted DsbA family dithiol-disulfide isomerase
MDPETPIDVYADVCCPFTHVGLRRLVERRRAMGATTPLRVRPWPLELVNGTPMDADFIAEEVVDIREQVAPDLFVGFTAAAFPASSLPALALVESAYEVGPAEGEAMSLALRDALFEDGRDIAEPAVLDELAGRLGVPPATEAHAEAVRRSWDEGKARGVVGSPHFFTPSGGFFCPTLDIARVDDGHLRITADVEAFDAFATDCFS